MKKLITILFILFCFIGYGQKPITQKQDFKADVRVIAPATITIPPATLPGHATPLQQAQDLFLPINGVVLWEDYISGKNDRIPIFRGDTALTYIENGLEGQVMAVVNGVPNWSSKTGWVYALLGEPQNTTGQTLINIPGMSMTLEPDHIYEVEVLLVCGVSADTDGAAFGIHYNGGLGASIAMTMNGSVTFTTSNLIQISDLNYPYSGWLTSSEQLGTIIMKGVILTGSTSQPLTPQYRKNTSGNLRVFSSSYMKVHLIE